MIDNDKKTPFLSIRKNDPQNIIVLFGLWICAATVALIIILNYSARRNSPAEIKRAGTIEHAEHKQTHPGHAYSGIAGTRVYLTKQWVTWKTNYNQATGKVTGSGWKSCWFLQCFRSSFCSPVHSSWSWTWITWVRWGRRRRTTRAEEIRVRVKSSVNSTGTVAMWKSETGSGCHFIK